MQRMTRIACLTLALALLLPLPFGGTASADDEYVGLPDEAGREEVAIYCGACHSLKLVVQQGLTRTQWEEMLQWMYDEQGMEPLEAADEKLVLDYLAEHVDPESHEERLRNRGIMR